MDELRKWLEDSPFDFGAGLAARALYRAFPIAINTSLSKSWFEENGPKLFHGLFVLATTLILPVKGHKFSAKLANDLNMPGAMSASSAAFYSSALRAVMRNISASNKAEKIEHAISAIMAIEKLVTAYGNSYLNSSNFGDLLERDKSTLGLGGGRRNAETRRLLSSPLFPPVAQGKWRNDIGVTRKHFEEVDGSYLLFDLIDEAGNFDHLSGNLSFELASDRQVARKMIAEIDQNFWGRSFAEIEGDARFWIEESSGQQSTRVIPLQNRNAIAFSHSGNGKIGLDLTADLSASPETDDEWIDRYQEARGLAESLLAQSKESNSAKRFQPHLEAYIASIGSEPSELRSSLFVQRGERLRQQLTSSETEDSVYPPLPDDFLQELKAWRSAHNLFVGLDKDLVQKDVLQFGPDSRKPTVFSPTEVRSLARTAEEEDILEPGVAEILREAADLAPSQPDPQDRRTVWSTETSRNFVIEAFEIAMSHPKSAFAGAIVAGAAAYGAGIAGSIVGVAAGAIPAARFLLKNRNWIELKLGDSPTWKGLFLDLCDWLQEISPPK